MTDQPLPLPGRLIDAVHLAATRAGAEIWSFDLDLGRGQQPVLTICLSHNAPRDLHAARAVFAQLGVTDVTIDPRPDHDHSVVAAPVPVMDTQVRIITDPIPDDPEPGDPAALLAEVDAARAAADAREG